MEVLVGLRGAKSAVNGLVHEWLIWGPEWESGSYLLDYAHNFVQRGTRVQSGHMLGNLGRSSH